MSLGDLGHWLLVETARWRAKDARPAVRDLQRGADAVRPGGKLTKESMIRLR